MARTATKLDSRNIDFRTLTLEKIKTFRPTYHNDEDVLFLQPDMPRAATSFDLEGEVWVRCDPETGEIVGLEIEDFERIFLKKHPELAEAWAEAKPLCRRKTRKKDTDMTWESFLLIIMDFLLAFLRTTPQQAELNIMPMRA